MKTDILDKLKKIKKEYQNIGFYIIGVFGSYARDEEKKSSDIDILYNIDKNFINNYGGWSAIIKIENIKKDIQSILGISKIDLATSDTNNQTLQKAIKEDLIYV